MNSEELKEAILNESEINGLKMIRFLPASISLKMWDEALEYRKNIDPETADYWTNRKLTSLPDEIMPGARSIILGVNPYNNTNPTKKDGIGEYSNHYLYYNLGHNAVIKIAALLKDNGYNAVADPPLPLKNLAWIGGIGYYGKNGLIHNASYGTNITIHAVLTDAVLPYDYIDFPKHISDCGECENCIKNCPTNAIAGNGTVIISRCLRYYMLSPDIIPVDIREAMDKRILGCQSCQTCCPFNKINVSFTGSEMDNDKDIGEIFNIARILTEAKTGLKPRMKEMSQYFGSNYARARRVLSMAAIIAGNIKDPAYIELLKETVYHAHIPVRVHSAWALGKIGGEEAMSILEEALKKEKDPVVKTEIIDAIKRAKVEY